MGPAKRPLNGMIDVSQWGLVFVGGGIGAMLRFSVGQVARSVSESSFPWATLTVNLVGSLLIGVLAGLSAKFGWPESARAFAIVGVLGGFTTFSAFSYENVQLLQSGAMAQACLNVVVQVVLGVALAFAGFAMTSPPA